MGERDRKARKWGRREETDRERDFMEQDGREQELGQGARERESQARDF